VWAGVRWRRFQPIRLLAFLVMALVADPAQANPTFAKATFSIVLAGVGPLAISGNGLVGVSATGERVDSLTIPASRFRATGTVIPVTTSAAAPIKGVQATVRNAAGAFSGGTLAGQMALVGVAKVCLFKACSIATANVSVPLSEIGVGGTIAVPPGSTSASVNLTVRGAPWTAGVAGVGTLTQAGFTRGPASIPGSTLSPSGMIRLVSPIFVSTNLGASAVAPGFAYLDLHFTPEPDAFALSLGGIAGVALLSRGRRRRAEPTADPGS
jgi:hypothetical protein